MLPDLSPKPAHLVSKVQSTVSIQFSCLIVDELPDWAHVDVCKASPFHQHQLYKNKSDKFLTWIPRVALVPALTMTTILFLNHPQQYMGDLPHRDSINIERGVNVREDLHRNRGESRQVHMGGAVQNM